MINKVFNTPSNPILDKWDLEIKDNPRLINVRKGIWACYDLLRGSKLPEVKEKAMEFLFSKDRKITPDLEALRKKIANANTTDNSKTNPEDLGLF